MGVSLAFSIFAFVVIEAIKQYRDCDQSESFFKGIGLPSLIISLGCAVFMTQLLMEQYSSVAIPSSIAPIMFTLSIAILGYFLTIKLNVFKQNFVPADGRTPEIDIFEAELESPQSYNDTQVGVKMDDGGTIHKKK